MTIDEVRHQFEEHDIRRVKLGGFDIDGVLRGKYVTREKFFSAVEKGMGFCDVSFGWDIADVLYDNAAYTGWHTGYPDLEATVDLSTFRPIPWEPGVAAFLLDFDPRISPRSALSRVVERADRMGFATKLACEFEFFLFEETPQAARDKGWQHLTTTDPGMFGYSWLRTSQHAHLVHDLLDGLDDFDCALEGFHTETGPGVYEAALQAAPALEAADRAALFKTAVKEICSRHGVMATFMAKWSAKYPGCSGHIHQSLWSKDGKENRFADPADPEKMSATLRHYLAGQLALMPELLPFYAPTVNSYKRFVPGTWAPTAVTWGQENRTCAARTITGPGTSAARIELRVPGADINPYLALAAALGSGLHGIENELAPPDPVTGNAYDAAGAPPLATNLRDATAALRASEVAPSLLGEDLVDHFCRTRDWEVREYEKSVSAWELDRYFELV